MQLDEISLLVADLPNSTLPLGKIHQSNTYIAMAFEYAFFFLNIITELGCSPVGKHNLISDILSYILMFRLCSDQSSGLSIHKQTNAFWRIPENGHH